MHDGEWKEFPIWFPDPVLGWKSDPGMRILHPLHRYSIALAFASDMKLHESYLDYACGTGFGTELVAPAFKKSLGIDQDHEALQYAARIHNRAAGLTYGLPPDMNRNAPYDMITAFEVIEHMDPHEGEQLVWKCAKVLQSTGLFLLSTPIAATKDGSSANHFHVREYHPAEIRGLLSKYFRKVEIAQGLGRCLHAHCREPIV